MLRSTQHGSRLFGIDASSDPTKFQDDWPTLSPLIGAWFMTWHQFEKIVKNWHQPVKWTFFGPKLILTISGRPNRSNGLRVNIYVSGEFEENRSRSDFCPISRDLVK